MQKIKILLDTMGYENALEHVIKAAKDFYYQHKTDLEIILVGNEQLIKPLLDNDWRFFPIVHTEIYIDQNDTILSARKKQNSSMHLALKYLKDRQANGMLTAGNSAVFVYNAYATIGLLEHIKKPAFMPFVPTNDGGVTNLLDVGASIDVDGKDLLNFAIMANAIAKMRVSNPRIGVLNIGTEKHKGLSCHQEANELLKTSNLNYVGFIEPKTILEREVDVLIADGFSGNIALKTIEGVSKTIANFLKNEYKRPKNLLAALFSKSIFKKMKKTFDYKDHAGAFVLGLNGVLVKTHGSADYQQFMSALKILYKTIKADVLNEIKRDLKNYYEQ
ncbi:phosphate acyltransferase PlsX [Ureaplasma parvum]|uniref:phosphate acyltransferase PlsX n=1 Tax=Ureaplasma parvum TaxID=134821 RepID=UPI0026F0F0C2|nr:phosphate acyltransferase PlsX [Ureaplasma parvum]